jgi:molybdopterin synthase catalytic subunit
VSRYTLWMHPNVGANVRRATIPRFAVGREPLDVDALTRSVADTAPGELGAVVAFLGMVRASNAGRRVLFLEYEAYEALALRALERIDVEARERWTGVRLAIHHRTGRLNLGETSIVIVAATAHRAEAYQACRYAIERVKQIVPIWKHEYFEGATAEPDDDTARAEAMNRACV